MSTTSIILAIIGGILLLGIAVALLLSMMLIALVSSSSGDFELDLYDEDDLHDHPRKESEKL